LEKSKAISAWGFVMSCFVVSFALIDSPGFKPVASWPRMGSRARASAVFASVTDGEDPLPGAADLESCVGACDLDPAGFSALSTWSVVETPPAL